MILTFKALSKNAKAAMFTGAARQIRINVDAFPDGQPPATIEVADGIFAGALSAEQRKAAKKDKPKPTLAERVKKEEARLARLHAKLAAEQSALPGAEV